MRNRKPPARFRRGFFSVPRAAGVLSPLDDLFPGADVTSLTRLALFAALFLPIGVVAQQPNFADPGQIEQRFEIEPTPQAQPDAPITMPQGTLAAPPPGAENVSFFLARIGLSGVTAYDPAILTALAEPFVGREVTLAEAFELAAIITAKYRRDGYVLSRAIIPPQEIEDSVIIRVVEGFIADIRVEGEVRDQFGLIAGGSAARDLLAARPLHFSDIERLVLVANDLAGVNVRSVIQPTPEGEAGSANLILVAENDRFAASASLDNFGSGVVGPVQTSFGGSVANIGGLFAKVSVVGVMADPLAGPPELGYGRGAIEVPIGADGFKLGFSAAHSRVNAGESLQAQLELDSTATTFTGFASYPVIRSRRENLFVNGEFQVHNSRTVAERFQDLELTDDRIRTLSLSASYDFADRFGGVNIVQGEVTQGLPIMNHTDRGMSRIDAEEDFRTVSLYAARYQNLGIVFGDSRLSAVAAMEAQGSMDRLPSSVEFSVGGQRFGRAYHPSEIAGESGIAGKFEIQFSDAVPALPDTTYQVFGFVDGGVIWDGSNSIDSEKLASIGVGARIDALDHISLEGVVAHPLGQGLRSPPNGVSDDAGDTRFLFSVSTRY